ncbi:hypothetical protein E8E13_005731 [Curvularia kusanoi]|uniref:Protein kinase domain-containing protein n=1 Tax=Curvularia kusanoi TaxID=90978 RepID=A0A9P4TJY7_CURKU|nr:hypothetical protein E8E13_005731 [Curvularia kusanoi]
MLTVADPSVLEAVEASESQNLLPRKVIDDARTIYSSHVLGLPKDSLWGQPVLCDFGEARVGRRHKGLVQPELYRAPEVLFDMEWDSSIDVWSIATLDLLENKHLFNALDEDGETSATDHVAEMVAYMGLPPLEFLNSSEDTRNVFDDEGRWTSAGGTAIPSITLEDSLSALDGDSKRLLLSFVRSMLRWQPEQRKKASDLLKDPWLAVILP